MAQSQQITTPKYSFQTKWIIKKDQLCQNLTTKMHTVEGMSDVKWQLRWSYSSFYKQCHLEIIIESESEIEYAVFARHENRIRAEFRSNTSSGKKFLELDKISYADIVNELLVNNNLSLIVNGCFSYNQKLLSPAKLMICDVDEWGLRLKGNIAEDFDIVVDGQIIKIHKPFLAAESPVFAKMFEDNFKEANENKVTIIDFKQKIVQAAVNYCYGQDAAELIAGNNDETDLLYFCDKYDFQTLKPKLELHLTKKVCKENLSSYISIADQANALKIRQACIDLICGMIDKKESHPGIDFKQFDSTLMADVLNQLMNRVNVA